MDEWQIGSRRERLSAILRAVVMNAVTNSVNQVNRASGVDGELRLLRAIRARPPRNLDWLCCRGRLESLPHGSCFFLLLLVLEEPAALDLFHEKRPSRQDRQAGSGLVVID